VGSCLSLLKNYSLLTSEEIAFYADEVKKLCSTLEKGEGVNCFYFLYLFIFFLKKKRERENNLCFNILEINRQFKPIFSISVASIVDDIKDEDGPCLSVELTNNLSTV
jgi:hypothetical protein